MYVLLWSDFDDLESFPLAGRARRVAVRRHRVPTLCNIGILFKNRVAHEECWRKVVSGWVTAEGECFVSDTLFRIILQQLNAPAARVSQLCVFGFSQPGNLLFANSSHATHTQIPR
jgi:hypothetical protein